MYRVQVRRHFDAAHALRGYQGKCENLHGHRWQVVVAVDADALDEIGLACDFTVLKAELDAVLAELDHHNLNETPLFNEINPSSEHIARHVYQRMTAAMPDTTVAYVEAWESPDAWTTYYPK